MQIDRAGRRAAEGSNVCIASDRQYPTISNGDGFGYTVIRVDREHMTIP
jgi:hypothetical protein